VDALVISTNYDTTKGVQNRKLTDVRTEIKNAAPRLSVHKTLIVVHTQFLVKSDEDIT
jgi:hypothetical protein